MADISIVNGIINQLITGGHHHVALLLYDHPGILMDFTKKNGDLMGFEWYLE